MLAQCLLLLLWLGGLRMQACPRRRGEEGGVAVAYWPGNLHSEQPCTSLSDTQVKTDALWTSELSMRRREDGERGGEAAGSEAAAAPAPPGGSSAAEAAAAAVEVEDLRASLAEVRRQLEEQAGLLRDLVAVQQQQARLGRVGLGQVAPVVWSPSRSGSATGNSVGEW